MALNQITVPGWAGSSAEAGSWKEHSCAWAGASSSLWRRLTWREEHFLTGSCQVPGTGRPPTAVGHIFRFFFPPAVFNGEPGNAGAVTHLRQAGTLLNPQTLRFGDFWTLSCLWDPPAFFTKGILRIDVIAHTNTHVRQLVQAFHSLDKGIK